MNSIRKYVFKTGIGYKPIGYAKYKVREYNSLGIDCIIKYISTNDEDQLLGKIRPYQAREIMYLLRDFKNGSIIIDISEYASRTEFLKHYKPLIQIACLNKIFIWVSNSKGNITKLIKYTIALKKYYSELGVVIDSNKENLEKYMSLLSKHNLSLILNCSNNDDEMYQFICNLTRQESIPRIYIYFPTGIPSMELQELVKWHKNSLHLIVSPKKTNFAIRAINKEINCSVIVSFGELFNKNYLMAKTSCSLNKFKILCD